MIDPMGEAQRKLGMGRRAGVSIAMLGVAAGSAMALPGPADTLSVEACVALAIARAPAVQAARADYAAAVGDSTAAHHNRSPALALIGGVTVAPHGFYDPAITNLGEYRAQLGVEWNLLDGGARARERARVGLDARRAGAALAAAAREAGVRAAAVAVDLLRQQDGARFLGEAVDWLDRFRNVIESSVRSGEHGRSDALRVALEQDAALAALLDAREKADALGRELAELIGRPGTLPPVIGDPGTELEQPPTEHDSLAFLARARSAPAVRQAEAERAQRLLEVEDARHRNALQADVSADAGLAGTDLTTPVPPDLKSENPDATFADRLRRDLGASVSLGLKRPVFDRARRPSIAARRASLEAATLRGASAASVGTREVQDLLGHWRAAAQRLATARSNVARAESNLLRLRSLYSGGAIGLLDVLDGRRQLDDVRDRLRDAEFEVRLAHVTARIP